MSLEDIGEKFYALPDDIKEVLLTYIRGIIFTRPDIPFNIFDLGYGIGKSILKMNDDWIRKITKECKASPNFCEGLARGVADSKFEDKRKLIAFLDSEVSASIFYLSSADLSNKVIKDAVLFAIQKIKGEKNLGEVGRNFGLHYKGIPQEIRERMMDLLKVPSFAYEFLKEIKLKDFSEFEVFLSSQEISELIGEKFNELNDFQKRKVFLHPTLGLGRGIGISFDQLEFKWKKEILQTIKNNKEMAMGFLEKVDPNSLEDFFQIIIEIVSRDEQLSFVLGRNFGENFSNISFRLKSSAIDLSMKLPKFGEGLGFGSANSMGNAFGFIKEDKILSEEDEELLFELAGKNCHIAKGMLDNLESLIFAKNKEKVLELVKRYRDYSPKFIELIERRIDEFNIDSLLSLAEGNVAYELGRILCSRFPYINQAKRTKVIEFLGKNREFYNGFVICKNR
ncbi:hypothetical protein CM19_06725 [Candidatus Acidianus copahuensis]|uniref:Uncharacterized protein n=1 Tax=Candidatus Acidianus copahuensis TaxID=1160895 RepID=A0A031LN85_9CREN|nr:hypothetical protein [Candidatus Acidianus copahuensis]EZQ07113.1 hypothetical protein CM19_06725 [Candidatus Acidianus copahuensis]